MNVGDERSRSCWMDEHSAIDAPPLDGDRTCDIVVIGSGIAGLSTAYELRRFGRAVIVIDRGAAAPALADLGGRGVTRVGTAGGTGVPPHELDLTGPVALVLGSEAHGLPEALASSIDAWASLPMEGSVESLNVAVAGSVLAFEVVRQRGAP